MHLHNSDWVLHHADVDVHGDVDLGALDLRGRLRLCPLKLTTTAGEPLPKGYLRVTDPATGAAVCRSARVDAEGRCNVVVPADLRAIVLDAGALGRAEVPASSFVTPAPGVQPARTTVALAP